MCYTSEIKRGRDHSSCLQEAHSFLREIKRKSVITPLQQGDPWVSIGVVEPQKEHPAWRTPRRLLEEVTSETKEKSDSRGKGMDIHERLEFYIGNLI